MTLKSGSESNASVLLAPPGAGKTEYAIQLLRDSLASQDWRQVLVLLPNRTQEHFFRQRLFAAAEGDSPVFNLRFLSFDNLAAFLLNLSDRPVRLIGDGEGPELLRIVLEDLEREGALKVFARAGESPGLLRAIARLLDDMREQLLSAADLAAAAQDARQAELAVIAGRYLATLQARDLQDRVGRLAAARDALDDQGLRRELRQVATLLVDGFDRFTPLQAGLLMRLAAVMERVIITLPEAQGAADGAGPGFRRALVLLTEQSSGPLRVPVELDRRDESLRRLTGRLLSDGASPLPATDSLHMLEAPAAAEEARAITRRIRRLLLESDARPEDCLIVLRDWKRYAGPLRAAGREHSVPLAFARGPALDQAPVICHLLNLLELPDADFPLQATLDALRAPCFRLPGLGRDQAKQLEAIARARRIAGGRDAWLAAIETSDAPDSMALTKALRAFMDHLTPPLPLARRQFLRWLRRLCGLAAMPDEGDWSLGMRAGSPANSRTFLDAREQEALSALEKILRDLERGDAFRGRQRLVSLEDAAECRRELRAALERERLDRREPQPGHAFVVDADDARGLSHRHLFIPGLSAGIFPRAGAVDPLLLAGEREALEAAGADLRQHDPGGDDALFLQLVGLARESLMLTRPSEENGGARQASHLWQAVMEVCPEQPVTPLRPGQLTQASDVASAQEALVALAGAQTGAASLRRWLQREQGDLLAHVEYARRIEAGRLSRFNGHDQFSGRLADPQLIRRVADELGPQRQWSATQLNDLGACRFRFFAGRILKLEELWQPEPGLNALELGTLNHAILERCYRDLKQGGLAIEGGNLGEALAALERSARDVFDDAERILGRPMDALWLQEQGVLRRRLEAFVRLDFSADSPVGRQWARSGRQTRWLEQGFGMGGVDFGMTLDVEGRAEALRLRGVIDRLDVVGDRALVIDYKSGSSTIAARDLREGLNVQMLVYLRAAQHLMLGEANVAPAGGVFLHLRNLGSSGRVLLDEKGEANLLAAERHIAENIAAARQGDFRVEPRRPASNGRCTAYCEFSEMCRVAVTHAPVTEAQA